MAMFKKATKSQARLRMTLIGASGSGKTYTGLMIAQAFGRVAVIDTEHGSASKYADEFDFDVCELRNFSPADYISAMHAAEAEGYDVLVIDSLSHAWMGKGGVLEIVDKATASSRSHNKFTEGWSKGTPEQNRLIDALVTSPCHIIATMRAKAEYVIEGGTPRKVGTAPVQRDGMDYEFDIVGYMQKAVMTVEKTRFKALDGVVIEKPDQQVGESLKQWLTDGVVQAWSADEMQTFVEYWKQQGMTSSDFKAALGVDSTQKWTNTLNEAHRAMREYIQAKTGAQS